MERDLLSFIKTEGLLASIVNAEGRLPPLHELNRVLGSGKGDDGFVIMRWDPFTIGEQEYRGLLKEFSRE